MPIHFTDVDVVCRSDDGMIVLVFSVPAERSGERQTVATMTCHERTAAQLEDKLRAVHGWP